MFTFSHRGILCCVLLSEGGKLPAVVRELGKRIWRVLIDVDNVDVDIRRDFPANRSLFVYTSGCIYPSGCCRNEVEEDSVAFHLPHLCPHAYYSGRRRTVWMRLLERSLHNIYLLCFIYLKRSHPSMHMHPKCMFYWIFLFGAWKDNKDRGSHHVNIWARGRSPPPPPPYNSHST